MEEKTPYTAVPIEVKAMLVPEGQKQEYAGLVMNYAVTGSHHCMAPSPESHPFTTKEHERIGAHLHWIMPDYLTHGVADGTSVVYPALPDRWLVTRFWWPEGTDGPSPGGVHAMRFIVQSNCLEKTRSACLHNEDSPSYPHEDSSQRYRFLGRSAPSWKKLQEPDGWLPRLTAVAPGSPYFAAYYPYCRNVFGLFDELLDEAGKPLGAVHLCYSVVGWHSRPEKGAAVEGAPPEYSIYHGMIYGMEWPVKPEHDPYYTTGKAVEVAVGNNSVEALSALTAEKNAAGTPVGGERWFNLLLHDNAETIERQDGVLETEKNLHRLGFGVHSIPHVFGWKPPDAEKRDPATLGKLFARLDEANRLLGLLRILEEKQAALGRDIYERWCLLVYLAENGGFPESVSQNITDALALLHDVKKDSETLRAELLTTLSGAEKESERLQNGKKNVAEGSGILKFPEEPFWNANNPVVLFRGLDRSFSYGYDGRFSQDNTLALRDVDQIITTLRLAVGNAVKDLNPARLVRELPEFESNAPESGRFAHHINALVREALLLCPALAPLWTRTLDLPDKERDAVSNDIRRLQISAQIGAFVPSLAETMAGEWGFTGTFPSKIALTCYHPQWAPLLLEWEISYCPDKNVLGETPDLSNWTLGSLDYVWGSEPFSWENALRLSGRVPITPQAAETMKNMAGKLALENAAQYGLADILSQALSDFHAQLLMRSQRAATPLYSDVPKLHDLTGRVREVVEEHVEAIPAVGGMFSPIRAGYLEIHSLRIIDSFGKFIIVRPERVARGESLRAATEAPFGARIMLPPRLMQPARLNVTWRGGKSRAVTAWLVHNHADKNLAVYAPDGAPLGYVQLTKRDEPAIWVSAPVPKGERRAGVADLPGGLREFVACFTDKEKKGYGNLGDFLEIMDAALERINHTGSPEYCNVCSFAGRPAALAAADVWLELAHEPVRFPDYLPEHFTPGGNRSIRLEQTDIRVRVGDPNHHNDGLIGMFDEAFSGFYSHYATGGGDFFHPDPVLVVRPQTGTSSEEEKRTTRFFVLDPLADVHFTSGLLPRLAVGLPDEATARAMDAILYALFAAPVLGSASALALPLPGVSQGRWAWLTPERETRTLRQATGQALFGDAPQMILEGWLALLRHEDKESP